MKRFLIAIGLGARRIMSQVDPNEKTLLAGWSGMTYCMWTVSGLPSSVCLTES